MKRQSRNKAKTESFDLVINGHMIAVNATPYLINGEETRFRVSYNDSPVFIFWLDPSTHRIAAMNGSTNMPVLIQQAISSKLEQLSVKRAA